MPSFGYCFSSIFRWHTETGNIWTHFIGGLIFMGLTLYYLLLPNMRFVAPFEEKLVFAMFFVSAILCLFFSTLYHTLGKFSSI
jgi:adiponectin receptor